MKTKRLHDQSNTTGGDGLVVIGYHLGDRGSVEILEGFTRTMLTETVTDED